MRGLTLRVASRISQQTDGSNGVSSVFAGSAALEKNLFGRYAKIRQRQLESADHVECNQKRDLDRMCDYWCGRCCQGKEHESDRSTP
jgi:hypothetical protein